MSNKNKNKVPAASIKAKDAVEATPAIVDEVLAAPEPAEFTEPEKTEEVIETPEEAVAIEEAEITADVALVATEAVSHNATLINWPTDVWGFTTELKKAIIYAASGVNGAEDKKELLDAVLRTGLGHIDAKFVIDSEAKQAAIRENERQNAIDAEAEAAKESAQAELF